MYRRSVTDFLAEVPKAKDGADLIERVWRRYADWRTMAGLRFSDPRDMRSPGKVDASTSSRCEGAMTEEDAWARCWHS